MLHDEKGSRIWSLSAAQPRARNFNTLRRCIDSVRAQGVRAQGVRARHHAVRASCNFCGNSCLIGYTITHLRAQHARSRVRLLRHCADARYVREVKIGCADV